MRESLKPGISREAHIFNRRSRSSPGRFRFLLGLLLSQKGSSQTVQHCRRKLVAGQKRFSAKFVQIVWLRVQQAALCLAGADAVQHGVTPRRQFTVLLAGDPRRQLLPVGICQVFGPNFPLWFIAFVGRPRHSHAADGARGTIALCCRE